GGRIAYVFQIFGLDFVLYRVPLGGGTLVSPRKIDWYRLKMFCVVLCGPLAHCLLIASALLMLNFMKNEIAQWVTGVFVWANIFMLAGNLWPGHSTGYRLRLQRDGLTLMKLPFTSNEAIQEQHQRYFYLEALESSERGHGDEAIDWLKRGKERYPDSR